MKRVVVVGVLSLFLRTTESHASCAYQKPEPVTIVVTACTSVDTTTKRLSPHAAAYAGLVLDGTTTKKGKAVATKVWVPATEKLTCAQVPTGSTVSGTLSFSCCDGDPNAPCLLETSSVLTKTKVAAAPAPAPPKPVKKATRAELEAEVEALRADNARLRAEIEAIVAREKERAKRLEAELDVLQKKLK